MLPFFFCTVILVSPCANKLPQKKPPCFWWLGRFENPNEQGLAPPSPEGVPWGWYIPQSEVWDLRVVFPLCRGKGQPKRNKDRHLSRRLHKRKWTDTGAPKNGIGKLWGPPFWGLQMPCKETRAPDGQVWSGQSSDTLELDLGKQMKWPRVEKKVTQTKKKRWPWQLWICTGKLKFSWTVSSLWVACGHTWLTGLWWHYFWLIAITVVVHLLWFISIQSSQNFTGLITCSGSFQILVWPWKVSVHSVCWKTEFWCLVWWGKYFLWTFGLLGCGTKQSHTFKS